MLSCPDFRAFCTITELQMSFHQSCICGPMVIEGCVWSSLPFPLGQFLQKSPHSSLWQPSAAQDLGLTAKFAPVLEPFTCSYSWETPIKPLAFNFLGNHGFCNLRWSSLLYGRLSKVCPSFFFSQHGICLLDKRKVPQKLSCVTSFC